jgi:sialate O-acetylesterase
MNTDINKTLTVHSLFGDGMVMQQGAAVPVRGRCAPNKPVSLRFLGKRYRAQADGEGNWQIILEPAESGGPFVMEITGGEETISLADIWVGEVWLCSGQSNMELPMTRLKDDFPEEWTPPVNSLIRQFKVPQEWDFSGPRRDLCGGKWIPASPETLGDFSGTAWFFARWLYETHQAPIGLINAALGGSPAEAWMSREALRDWPHKGEQYAVREVREQAVTQSIRAIADWERAARRGDAGRSGEWQRSELDDRDWDEISLPGDFADAGLVDFCGVLWLRKQFTVPPEMAAKPAKIWLGTIVDADRVYINGVEAGNITYRYPPRKYPIPPEVLREGWNQITIRVTCNNGQGGITRGKPFRIFSEQGSIELAGNWKYKAGVQTAPRPAEFFVQWEPTGLYNAMIAPLLRYPLRGVIWYQGESNENDGEAYAPLFAALVRDWRRKMGNPELPFVFVQLPLWGRPSENREADKWAVLREAQAAALALPATGMAAALDLGEWNDLHPVNKKGVGDRLAMAAEAAAYGGHNTAPGPTLREVIRRGETLRLAFVKCGAGLYAPEPVYLTVLFEGGKAKRLPAGILEPDTLLVDIAGLGNPQKILYAWADNPTDRHLYNSDGLPALPFRSVL